MFRAPAGDLAVLNTDIENLKPEATYALFPPTVFPMASGYA